MTGAEALTPPLSIAEQLQLVLGDDATRVRAGYYELAAAALLEAAIAGAFVADLSERRAASDHRLRPMPPSTPVDPAVLEVLGDRPVRAPKALVHTARRVPEATIASLVARGLIVDNGPARRTARALDIVDRTAQQQLFAEIAAGTPRGRILDDLRRWSGGRWWQPVDGTRAVTGDYGVGATGATAVLWTLGVQTSPDG